MLTRCPNCSTTFRVQPDQLKVRHGKVRCGSCQQVFNALDTLVEEPAQVVTLMQLPPGLPTGPESAAFRFDSAESVAIELPAESGAHASEPDSVAPIPEDESANAELDTVFANTDDPCEESSDESNDDSPLGVVEQPQSDLSDDQSAIEMPQFQAMPLGPAAVTLVEPASLGTTGSSEAALDPPEAVAEHPRLWRQMLLAAAIGLALAVLLLQAVFFWRAELARTLPETQPILEAACQRLGCVLEWPRRPDLLSIESSDLNPEPADVKRLRLVATVRNRAPHVQAWPHLEISLTDTEDRAIVRRVLAPADYLPYLRGQRQRDGLAAASEFTLEIHLDPGSIAASGYRLYLFYP